MQLNTTVNTQDVKDVLVDTLGLEGQADRIDATTPLLGSLPQLDSMAVLELVVALEQRFGIAIDGEDVTADVFESLGSLAAFVDGKLR
jgi:acyl carrier protein